MTSTEGERSPRKHNQPLDRADKIAARNPLDRMARSRTPASL